MAPPCMGSGSRPTCSSGRWGHWLKGWVSARWLECFKSTLILYWPGWWMWRTIRGLLELFPP